MGSSEHGTTVRRIWEDWSAVQRGFFVLGATQLAVAGTHTALALLGGGSLEGPVSIRKPILFSQSFGLVSLTFSFTWNDLGLPRRRAAFLGWLSIALSGIEVAFATLQFWRGLPSHFNYATLFDGMVAGTMTTGALIFAIFLVWVTALSSSTNLDSWPAHRRSFVYGVRWSLPLALFGLGAMGLIMLLNGGQTWHGISNLQEAVSNFRLGRYNGQSPALGSGASLMLSHALGAHVLQILPLCGWLAGRGGASEGYWRPRVRAVGISYAAVMALAAAQVFWIQAPLREGGPVAGGLLLSVLALGASMARLLQPAAERSERSPERRVSRASWLDRALGR